MQAAKLLFDQPDSTESSIFGRPTDLAAFMVEHGLYSGQIASVTSFISQVIQRGERSCPDRLRNAVCEAVRVKAGDQLAERARRALEVDDLVRRTAQPLSAEALYYELQAAAEVAAEHYIITAKPAEQVVSARATPLRETLLRRLGLTKLIDGDRRPAAPDTRYTFCLPSKDAGIRFWKALFHEIRSAAETRDKTFDQRRVHRTLAHLSDTGKLRVFAVPSYLCGCPVVVFDPNSAEPQGFVMYYHSDKSTHLVSVARMDATYLETWKELVHSPLEVDQVTRELVDFTS